MSKKSFFSMISEATGKALGQVESLRQEIRAKQATREHILEAPIPKAEAKQRLSAALDHFVSEARPSMRLDDLLSVRGAGSGLLTVSATSFDPKKTGVGAVNVNLGPLMAWLFRDLLEERLASIIDGMEYEAGPPSESRRAALEKVERELRALEEKEEALICEAEEAGMDIARRPDCDPRIVLEVEEYEKPDTGPTWYQEQQELLNRTHQMQIKMETR